MNGAGEAAEVAPAGARYPGLLEKLMAAVRPEFRVDVVVPGPQDPIFGGPVCLVSGCRRAGRARGLCFGHHRRWSHEGKPDLQQFAAVTDPRLRGHAQLRSCRAPGCRYGRRLRGLCTRHDRAWQKAGRPDLDQWLPALPAADPADPPIVCRVSYCDLWIQGNQAPLCMSHMVRWRALGRPGIEEFLRDVEDDSVPGHERIDLQRLGRQLRLEVQYVLQCRRDEGKIKTRPGLVQHVVNFLASTGLTSLLDWPEQTWRERFARRDPKLGTSQRALILFGRRQIEDLTYGRGWEVEYPRDIWRLRNLGIDGSSAHVRFDRIPQPWLKDLAKRWVRWRLATGLGGPQAARCAGAVTRFAAFLASPTVGIHDIAQLDRAVLERYLGDLHTELAGKRVHGDHIGLLNGFLTAIRQHNWSDHLPTNAMFFIEDYPKRGEALPRALAEHVMTQLERPENLQLWDDPARRLITLILMRCGLRVGDARRLPHDCITRDADDAPYLRYNNHKMKREALVPIDDEVEQLLRQQQRRVLDRWPDGAPVLFPQRTANPDGRKPISDGTYRDGLSRWLERCDIRDETGRRALLTPHQWRHTLGTRLINRDVPQEVVRKILDHDSPAMTSHYARVHDTTVRRHWEQARKVNAQGETVTLDPDGPLAEAAWAKQRLGRATQALPNGYCGLPAVRSCPHANACLTCPMFITTPEFLPQHRQQHQQTLQIISAAEARGQTRITEMNQQVADNLEKIITALENDKDEQREEAADAS